ncbi:MAG: TRAP transporter TatT component family protein [Pseudomonadota bacterium]
MFDEVRGLISRMRPGPAFFIVILLLSASGCSGLVSSAAGNLAGNLSKAISDSNDLETVHDGGPAYLLLIDGLLESDPENESLLRAAASLNGTYASVFVKDEARAAGMTGKALKYGLRAACLRNDEACALQTMDFESFSKVIEGMDKDDVPVLLALGSAWAGWIQTHADDMNAVAQIARVEEIMTRVIELDEPYQDGAAHLYLGALSTFLPPALGGRPEEGRRHFERAVELSGGRNLMAKVLYAKQYARLMFDRDLHDKLLREVLDAPAEVPGYTLSNTYAKVQARELLDGADDFF